VDPSDPVCKVDLRAGLIELENVRISSEYLAKQSTMPVDVRDSHVRSVRVKFSLSSLLTRRRIEVEMDGIALVITPRLDPPIEVARAIFRAEKQRLIAGAELWQAHARSISASLGAPGDSAASAGGGGMRKLRAFVARVAQQALLNAIVRVSHVHIRYECAVGASGQPVALGIMVRSLVVSEAPRDHPRDHPHSREHPSSHGFASRAACVDELAIYCEAAYAGTDVGAAAPAQAGGTAPLVRTSTRHLNASHAGALDARSIEGLVDAQACLREFDEDPQPGTYAMRRRWFEGEIAVAPGKAAPAGGEPSWLLCPLSFELRLTSQTGDTPDLSHPATTITVMPWRHLASNGLAEPSKLRPEGGGTVASPDRGGDAGPLKLRVRLSAWQIDALEAVDKSLVLYVRRQRARINGRPESPVLRAPRDWWRYALRCIIASREALRICTELSGHSWGALWRVLAMRQRYLQLHRRGRYRFDALPPLSQAQAEELLHMEDLLELDTILLFRRFVDWQMVSLHGEVATKEAYSGIVGPEGGKAPVGYGGLRVLGNDDVAAPRSDTVDDPEADKDGQLALSDLQSLTHVFVNVLSRGGEKGVQQQPPQQQRGRPLGLRGWKGANSDSLEEKSETCTAGKGSLEAKSVARTTRTKPGSLEDESVACTSGETQAPAEGPRAAGPTGTSNLKLKPPAPMARTPSRRLMRLRLAPVDDKGRGVSTSPPDSSPPHSPTPSDESTPRHFSDVSRPPPHVGLTSTDMNATTPLNRVYNSGCASSLGSGFSSGSVLRYDRTLSADSLAATGDAKEGAFAWPLILDEAATPATPPHQAQTTASTSGLNATDVSRRQQGQSVGLCKCLQPFVQALSKPEHAVASNRTVASPPLKLTTSSPVPMQTPPPLKPLRSALASTIGSDPHDLGTTTLSRSTSRVSFKVEESTHAMILSRSGSKVAFRTPRPTPERAKGEGYNATAPASTPVAAQGSQGDQPHRNPFGDKEAFLLRPRGAPAARLQPSRERRVRRKRNHLFAQLHDALQQNEATRDGEGLPARALPAWLSAGEPSSQRNTIRRSYFSRASSFFAEKVTLRSSVADGRRRSSLRRSLHSARSTKGVAATGTSPAIGGDETSAVPERSVSRRERRRHRSRDDWKLLGVQGLLYETWRESHPQEVQALEALTSAAMRDANSNIPPEYKRLRFTFAEPIAAEMRVFASGRQKLVVQTEQLVVQFVRMQDKTKDIKLLIGPVSTFAYTLRLCNQTKLAAANASALDRLRAANVADAARRPPLPHQTAAAQLLEERHGVLFLSYTKAADTRLVKPSPDIKFCLAPDIAAEAHFADGFVLNVPKLHQHLPLSSENDIGHTSPTAAISAAIAASSSIAASAATAVAGGTSHDRKKKGLADMSKMVPVPPLLASTGSGTLGRRAVAGAFSKRPDFNHSSEDTLLMGKNARKRMKALSFTRHPREASKGEQTLNAKSPDYKRSLIADTQQIKTPAAGSAKEEKERPSSTLPKEAPIEPRERVASNASNAHDAEGTAPTAKGSTGSSRSRLLPKPVLKPKTSSGISTSTHAESDSPSAAVTPSECAQVGAASSSSNGAAGSGSSGPSSRGPSRMNSRSISPVPRDVDSPSGDSPLQPLSPPPPPRSASTITAAVGMAGDRLNDVVHAVLWPRAERAADLRHTAGAVEGPLLLGTVGSLVVPQTAVVVSAMLPDSLAIFCHAPSAMRGAPPFVYVPILSARRVDGLLGYTHIEYDMGVVQALGAGEKLPRRPSPGGNTGSAAPMAPLLTGVLRSADVVARPLFARRLLEHYEQRRWQRGIGKLDAEREETRERLAPQRLRGCFPSSAGQRGLADAGGIFEGPTMFVLLVNAWIYEAMEKMRAAADKCFINTSASGQGPPPAPFGSRGRGSFIRKPSSLALANEPTPRFPFLRCVPSSLSGGLSHDELSDDSVAVAPPRRTQSAFEIPPRGELNPATAVEAHEQRDSAGATVPEEKSKEAEQVAGMVELEGRIQGVPSILRLASFHGALEGVDEGDGAVSPSTRSSESEYGQRTLPKGNRQRSKWGLIPFSRRYTSKQAEGKSAEAKLSEGEAAK